MKNECSDPTQSITFEIPCALVERLERYAQETGTLFSGVVIEALDSFLLRHGQDKGEKY